MSVAPPNEEQNRLAALRVDYTRAGLTEAEADPDPIAQFQRWFDEALAAAVPEPNAMTLATVTAAGWPSARVVLLKGVDARGFTFYTNYSSRKGRELDGNPRAALVFFWKELERQVRVEGAVERVSAEESDDYFASRPPGSQLGAHASPQSRVIASREELDASLAAVSVRFASGPVPRPPSWGGFRVVPEHIELWQGRPSRLHDRLSYRRARVDAAWVRERLAP